MLFNKLFENVFGEDEFPEWRRLADVNAKGALCIVHIIAYWLSFCMSPTRCFLLPKNNSRSNQ